MRPHLCIFVLFAWTLATIQARVTAMKLLPNERICGIQETDRIVGGQNTILGEFPWVVLLSYQNFSSSVGFQCGGTLISQRYILTAAHCVEPNIPRNWKLVTVRLGEHNTETQEDCMVDENGGRECATPVQDIAVEEVIPHEQYDKSSRNRHHDIALVRLARNVQYSPYVRPICLPNKPEHLRLKFDKSVQYVAGWGRTVNGGNFSPIKQKLNISVVNNDVCASTYSQTFITLGEGQMCAGGEYNRDSCRGDSGGPLMTNRLTGLGPPTNWYAIGLVSFGARECGTIGWPGIYTRLTVYMPWILRKLKP